MKLKRAAWSKRALEELCLSWARWRSAWRNP